MRAFTRDRSARIWGEGFAWDGWSSLQAATDWNEIGQDELARLFPRLVPRDGTVPGRVLTHLADGVAARAWRLRHVAKVDGMTLSGTTWDAVEANGARRRADLVVVPGRLGALWAQWRGTSSAQPVADEIADLAFLDEVLAQARRRGIRPASAVQTAAFAFLSGIHPAYLWPSALATHERDAAAGWLGIVARGRPALMTTEVAAYFEDAISGRAGELAIRDRQIAGLATRAASVAALRDAALAHGRGEPVVVRRATRAFRGSAFGSGVSPGAWALPGLVPADQGQSPV